MADPTGCDIELTGMVLGALGVGRVDFVLTTFGELIDGVTSRRWHINAPMFITAERSRRVRFSVPVWAATDHLTKGASLKDVMRRLGHASTRAALIYQHADLDSEWAIAASLSETITAALAGSNGHAAGTAAAGGDSGRDPEHVQDPR